MTLASSSVAPVCFIAIPHQPEFDSIRAQLVDFLVGVGVEPLSIDLEQQQATPPESVRRAIQRCGFVLADVTGRNPNVMYEIGFAHGIRKEVLLIMRDDAEAMPWDLQDYQYVRYDPSDSSHLVRAVGSLLRGL